MSSRDGSTEEPRRVVLSFIVAEANTAKVKAKVGSVFSNVNKWRLFLKRKNKNINLKK